jgi:hypothetical protein
VLVAETAADGLVRTTVASSDRDGALVTGISGVEAAALAVTNPGALLQYVNADLQAALAALPEGTRMELVVSGWSLPAVGSVASSVADRVNAAWAAGQVDYGGEPVQAWPEYPGQVAWGDDGSATVTIRVLKAQWQALLFVFIGILVVAAVWVLWDGWRSSATPWQANAASPSGIGTGSTGLGGLLKFLAANWWWELPVVGAVAFAPWAINKLAAAREAENRLAAAERGEF